MFLEIDNFNLYMYFTTITSVVSDLRSRLAGELGGPQRAQKICEIKKNCMDYVLVPLKL
jgi:hypothetical protein